MGANFNVDHVGIRRCLHNQICNTIHRGDIRFSHRGCFSSRCSKKANKSKKSAQQQNLLIFIIKQLNFLKDFHDRSHLYNGEVLQRRNHEFVHKQKQ